MSHDRRRSFREIGAALGVVASLLFVGYEIRQNTSAQWSATLEGVLNQRIEFNLALWSDLEVADLMLRLRQGAVAADLTPVEVQRARLIFIHYMRIVEGAWRQVNLGVIDASVYLTFDSAINDFPFFREQFSSLRNNFDPTFGDFFQERFMS